MKNWNLTFIVWKPLIQYYVLWKQLQLWIFLGMSQIWIWAVYPILPWLGSVCELLPSTCHPLCVWLHPSLIASLASFLSSCSNGTLGQVLVVPNLSHVATNLHSEQCVVLFFLLLLCSMPYHKMLLWRSAVLSVCWTSYHGLCPHMQWKFWDVTFTGVCLANLYPFSSVCHSKILYTPQNFLVWCVETHMYIYFRVDKADIFSS